MARTTVPDVQAVIDTSLTDDAISAYIDDANLWVTEELVGKGLSAARLEAVEKYLACHFVTLQDPRLKEAELGGRSGTREAYQRDENVTEYLKAAAAMDSTGTIENRLMGKRQVTFRVAAGYDDDLDLPEAS